MLQITCDAIIGNNLYIHHYVAIGPRIQIGVHAVIGSNSQIGGDK